MRGSYYGVSLVRLILGASGFRIVGMRFSEVCSELCCDVGGNTYWLLGSIISGEVGGKLFS